MYKSIDFHRTNNKSLISSLQPVFVSLCCLFVCLFQKCHHLLVLSVISFFFYSVEREWAYSHFIDEATEALPHLFLDETADLRMRPCAQKGPGSLMTSLNGSLSPGLPTSGFVLHERNNQLLGLVTLAAFITCSQTHS